MDERLSTKLHRLCDQEVGKNRFTVKAKNLLAHIRRTPMATRGRLRESDRALRHRIAHALEIEGVFPQLAIRIALQLVIKCDEKDLGTPPTWAEIGVLLRRDSHRLQGELGLVERQIVVALPKLSAQQIEALLAQLRAEDSTIARTVLNVALDAAEPVTAGRRYMDQFHDVMEHLTPIDPDIARTFANKVFMARSPRVTAIEHFTRFLAVLKTVRSDVPFARTVAKAACRAPDPAAAAKRFIADYNHIRDFLTRTGADPAIARSLASIASVAAEPLATARVLLERYERVLPFVHVTHPAVARSISSMACRFADPLAAATRYINAYDAVVRTIQRIDPCLAHSVASRAFRSAKPLQAAKRYLKELQQAD